MSSSNVKNNNAAPAAAAPAAAANAAAAVNAAAAHYDYAIFFDNEPKRIVEVETYCSKNIQCVKVNETEGLRDLAFADPRFKQFLTSIGINADNNQYYARVSAAGVPGDALDLLSGINAKEFKILNDWIEEHGRSKRAAIFDWDRTLTVFEGYFSDADIAGHYRIRQEELNTAVYQNDKLIYLMGGQERLNQIRQMFALLYENNIDVIILTNNGGCIKPEFDLMMNYLLPEPRTYQKICSKLYDPPSGPAGAGHKGLALRGHALFGRICSPEAAAANAAGGAGAAAGGAGAAAGGAGTGAKRGGSRRRRRNRKQRKSRRSNRK